MKVFSGLYGSDKSTNKAFAAIFFTALAFSIFLLVTSPQKDELGVVTGTLLEYECNEIHSGRSEFEMLEVSLANSNGDVQVLTHTVECKNLDFKEGAIVNALYSNPIFGSRKLLLELVVDGREIVVYEEERNRIYQLPGGIILIFGMPWLLWFLIIINRHQKLNN